MTIAQTKNETESSARSFSGEKSNNGGSVAVFKSSPLHSQALVLISWLLLFATTALLLFLADLPDVFRNTLPRSGDISAHMYNIDYLRRVLLPEGRLTGWSHEWFTGYPVYRFYFVFPALIALALMGSVPAWLALGMLLFAGVCMWRACTVSSRRLKVGMIGFSLVLLVLGCSLPFGPAIKVTMLLGSLLLPAALFATVRAVGVPHPVPGVAAVAALLVLGQNWGGYYPGFTLWDAALGEFSSTLGLSLSFFYLAALIRSARRNREVFMPTVLLTMIMLTHAIAAIVCIGWTIMVVLIRFDRQHLWWVVRIGGVAALLSSWWTAPFLMDRHMMFQPGYGGLPWMETLLGGDQENMKLAVALAIFGLILGLWRRQQTAVLFGLFALIPAVAGYFIGGPSVVNHRFLGYWMSMIAILATMGVSAIAGEAQKILSGLIRRHPLNAIAWVHGNAAVAVAGIMLLARMALPYGMLPGAKLEPLSAEEAAGKPGYLGPRWNWGPLQARPNGIQTRFSEVMAGLDGTVDGKDWDAHIATLRKMTAHWGCGRLLWERNDLEFSRYGYEFAPVLWPMLTNGCVQIFRAAMYEGSWTTHLLSPVEIGFGPHYGIDIPSSQDEFNRSVALLNEFGIRYLMVHSPFVIERANLNPRLEHISSNGVWSYYQVKETPHLIVSSPGMPYVITNPPSQNPMSWLYEAVTYLEDPNRWSAPMAEDGPLNWVRVPAGIEPPRQPIQPVAISDVQLEPHRIRFSVDRVGVPVIVRVAWFPAWKATGADGPFRTPTGMIVIPKQRTVALNYGTTLGDTVGRAPTLIGLGIVIPGVMGWFGMPLIRRRRGK